MQDLLLSEAIGDIAGSAYEFCPTKAYDQVQLFHPRARFTDDTVFHLKQGRDKDFIRKEILQKYYPDWAALAYKDFHQEYEFDVSCQGSVGPAIICFLESKDYTDCIKLCIALGGDSDTLAAIAGPMAYAYYKEMPATLVERAKQMLPPWMLEVNDGVRAERIKN